MKLDEEHKTLTRKNIASGVIWGLAIAIVPLVIQMLCMQYLF